MGKDIEIIKSLIEDLKREEKLIGYNAEVEIQALENLINRCKELENRIISLTNLLCINDSDENYILKSKIQEKIEELENMIKETINGKLQKYTVGEIIHFKKFLEELMEG